MNSIIIAGFGLLLFFVGASLFFVYRQGLKDGLAVKEGKAVEPIHIPSPVRILRWRREAKAAEAKKAQEDRIAKGMANIFSYDGKPQEVSK